MGQPRPDPRMVEQAIDLYTRHAYPEGVPSKIAALIHNLTAATGDFYDNPAFEKQDSPGGAPGYRLRLGCSHYPHMKLVISTWGGDGYFFQVDTHDRHIVVPRGHAEFDAFSELRRKNQAVVEAIEVAWNEAEIPTFSSCFDHDLTARETYLGEQ